MKIYNRTFNNNNKFNVVISSFIIYLWFNTISAVNQSISFQYKMYKSNDFIYKKINRKNKTIAIFSLLWQVLELFQEKPF